MSGSYRQSIRSAVILILIAATAYAQPTGRNGSAQPCAQPRQAQPITNPNPSLPPAVQDDLNRIAGALEASNAHPEATAEQQRAQDDLKAQQDMAKWAKFMFWAATAETLVTLVGVILVWLTLNATWAAKGEAKRAADAAEKTVDTMQTFGRQELRAYLSVNPVNHGNFGASNFNPIIALKNTGQTPATDVTAWICGAVLPHPHSGDLPANQQEPKPKFVLGPGTEHTLTCEVEMTNYEKVAFLQSSNRIQIWGEANYTDAFNERRRTKFRMTFGGKDAPQIGLQWASDGNEAT